MIGYRTNQLEQVEFLPQWYVAAQRQKKSYQRQAVLLAMMIGIMASLWSVKSHEQNELKIYFSTLEQQIQMSKTQMTEMDKLQLAKQQLGRQVQLYQKLAQPITFYQINGTLVHYMPRQISMHSYTCRIKTSQVEVKATNVGAKNLDMRNSKKALTKTITKKVLNVEIEGSSPTNIEVANFVGQLAGSNLFTNVKMVYSRQGKIGTSITRHFKIVMEVPLDRIYQSKDNQEVANAY